MTDAALSTPLSSAPPTPPFMAVFSEQLGLIGRALWREGAILGVIFLLLTLVSLYEIFNHGMTVDFPIEVGPLVAIFSLLAGLAVWRGERLFDQGHLLTLPVARGRHLMIRTLAGGVWLSGIIAWVLLWIVGMGMLSGGDLGFDRYLLTGPLGPDGQIVADGVRMIRWTPQAWHWLSAFTTAAVFYLLGAAFAVGAQHKLRWAVLAFGVVALMFVNPLGFGEAFADATVRWPVGLDNLLTGGLDQAEVSVILLDGKPAIAWSRMPSPAAWAWSTAFWLVMSLGLLTLAAWRHRER